MNDTKRLHDDIAAALADSAPLAWRMAPEWCHRDPVTGASCVYYHRVWQYLLLLGATTSLGSDTGFLLDALSRVFRARADARVLICGTADYAMLAHVLSAARAMNAAPAVTVLDRCRTALELNAWYARRQQVQVRTVEGDILEWDPAGERYDAICAHSFLGWFSPAQRECLVRIWRELLVPGGCVITTKRLRDVDPGEVWQKFDDAEAAAFAARVRTLAGAAPARIGDTRPDDIARAALAYAHGHKRYPMRSRDELVALFHAGGLRLDTLDDDAQRTAADRPSGPRHGAGPRLRIVARRD